MFDTPPPHRLGVTACWCVKRTNPSSAQVSASTCHSPWVTLKARPRTRPAPGPRQARTRPAPGPRQGFFRSGCNVTHFDDLRAMEPVSDIIGHCFVVRDTRHQLRASMPAGWRGSDGQARRNFRQLSPHFTTGIFFSQLSPHRTTGFFFRSCPPTGPLDFFFTVVG